MTDIATFLFTHGLLDTVIEMAGGPYLVTGLRASCKAASLLVKKPEHLPSRRDLFRHAVISCNTILCKYLKDEFCVDSSECMLYWAAGAGHENICRLAKEWGATSFDLMIANGAWGGHVNICRLAKAWGVYKDCHETMLTLGAWSGHENICRLAKEWGASDFNLMLKWAAGGGRLDMCRLAKEWGATDFNSMLTVASDSNYFLIRNLAIEWGATNS